MVEVNSFLDYLKFEKGNADKTIESYRNDLYTFFKKVNKKVVDITSDDIYQYIEKLKEKYTYNTVIRKISSIKSFFKFCYIEKIIKNDPANKIHNLKKEKRLPNALSVEEINSIIQSFNHEPVNRRNQLIVKFLVATGARISEVINLEIKDIENSDFEFAKLYGKGSKYRFVPIYLELEKEIKEYIREIRPKIKGSEKSYLLFPGIRRENFWKILNKHAQNVGIEKKIHPHLFRHSTATMMIENGADIRIVQELLGHASITTTEVYTHVEKSKLREIYKKVKIGEEDE
ncbi:tyrosine-type recombinase/integrase [Streptobacillus moniliformis]|uniref:Integrase family protein n=1 Tax=Streptobacillus moniliformis (strain ATCC 14647 / DSM 12112 / NCTC 10651 / 9901) TaxID=519441 RepID=D1AX16_STRM9|nr:tyrosine-type recombinase/integrase [Streptobacillus moniliformis]ACZ00842.1 integrase family protein [Streptobacillus moniliformis DSM 12112]AVL42766.1 integrase [Streptobacillus moniliformis]QXW65591.1 tyrosine-type recombinase/integrase [Streptobacillus moniliformis]SQA14023.1 Tyrosine recombinase XerD [Streptobacillus moniliformis]